MKCRTILLILIVIHLIDNIVKADEPEEEAEDSVKEPRQKKQKGCKNLWGKRPKWYKKGKSVIKGCYKFTCTSPKPRRYEWVQELARTKCCSFNESFVAIGSTLLTKVLPNECTTTFLRCKKKEVFAELELDVEDECPEPPGIMNVLTVPEETIQSARYPSPYPKDQDECWMRTPSCGHYVHIKFEHFDVLGEDAFVTIDPPISGDSIFYGNDYNHKHVPPKTIDFPQDTAVKVCFYSGDIVSGHKGFKARISERKNNHYVTSPNYPEDINDETYMDPPPSGYGPNIHHCTVRAPAKGRALHMEFHQFDVNAPPERYGDWVTIYPNPTDREKYYGVSLKKNTAPPRHHLFLIDDIVTICFKTRSSVNYHDGYVADIYQDNDPTTMDSYTSYDYYTDYYDYTYISASISTTTVSVQGQDCVGEPLVRRNVKNIKPGEYEKFNNPLGKIKKLNDLKGFENIANYHGIPNMCNENLDGPGTSKVCCLPHGDSINEGFIELFGPWHRLYELQMELALNDVSTEKIAMPYWDWVEDGELPLLAEQGEWQNGPIRGQGINTHRNFTGLDTTSLNTSVYTSYQQDTTLLFNQQIQLPHDNVHIHVGGSMRFIAVSSYDPIFYLHHSNVDRQYAFWQELQRLRNIIPIKFKKNKWEMQPFPREDVNPFPLTRDQSTAPEGLDYEGDFCYKYDELTFNGKTPKEVYEIIKEDKKQPQLHAGIVLKDPSISSKQYFDALKGAQIIQSEAGFVSTFGEKTSNKERTTYEFYPNNLLYDVTRSLDDVSKDSVDRTLHFNTSRYEDSEGNKLSLSNTYKPAVVYRKPDTDHHVVRIHVDHIEDYSPSIVHCHINSSVEFLESDGSFSTRVTTDSRNVDNTFQITKVKNKFEILTAKGSVTSINIGYQPRCHLQCDDSGLPFTGHPYIKIVPWNLQWIESYQNMVDISSCDISTVLIAWCKKGPMDIMDIVKVSNKEDFDSCSNLAPENLLSSGGGDEDVGGFIAIQNTKEALGSHYFASLADCQYGFKIQLKVTECTA